MKTMPRIIVGVFFASSYRFARQQASERSSKMTIQIGANESWKHSKKNSKALRRKLRNLRENSKKCSERKLEKML
jgi:hypothetical protein